MTRNTSHRGSENLTYQTELKRSSPVGKEPGTSTPSKNGAQLIVETLMAQGVEVVFGYPGGANLEIFDAIDRFGLPCIRTEHEQGAVHAAQGYARSSGRLGVCLATSGPGATNLVTGIADANSDSTAILCITGNVPSHLLGKNAFQEVDIVSIVTPITKIARQVIDVNRVIDEVSQGVLQAMNGRPGPVLLDFPKDVQQAYCSSAEAELDPVTPIVGERTGESSTKRLSTSDIRRVQQLISQAEKPVLYVGGGVVSASCEPALLQLAEKLDCPVTTTVMAHGAFPPKHRLALQCLGMHGSVVANTAVNEADLVIALGVRFDDRVTGDPEKFIEDGSIIHIDVDPAELNKNKAVDIAICADLRDAIPQLTRVVESCCHSKWLSYLSTVATSFPLDCPDSEKITPQYAIGLLSEMTAGKAIVAMGVGQHQMWAMQHYEPSTHRSFLSSSGFGTMGFGLPAAIGAKVAHPDRLVVDIDGDGSLNMTIQELATCHRYSLGVKVVVINNQWLGMVRQWQDMIYNGRRAESDLSDPRAGSTQGCDTYPNFSMIARGYRVESMRITLKSELVSALERLLRDPSEPFLLDVIVEAERNVYPMIPAGGSYKDVVLSDADVQAFDTSLQGDSV